MKQRTDNEIMAKLKELWPEAEPHGWDSPAYQVDHKTADEVRITVGTMYSDDDIPVLTFEKRLSLSEFFDTMNVDTEEELIGGGCYTCGYGGSHGFVAVIRDGDPYKHLPES